MLSMASYAAAQVDAEGSIVAHVQGTVPGHLPQSSQAAEHYGRLAAIRLLQSSTVLYGDCKNVVMNARLSDVAAQDCRMYAGMRRAAVRSRRLQHVAADVKVKAHRDESEATSAEDLQRLRGNRAADELAKMAMDLHPNATARIVEAKGDYKEMVDIARTIVATIKLWPPTVKMQRDLEQPRAPKTKVMPQRVVSHDWQCKRTAGCEAYYCTTCLTSTRDLRTYRIRYYQKCPGLCLTLAAIVAYGDAHQLAFSNTDPGGEPIVACMKCGLFASTRIHKLRDTCKCRGMTPYGRSTIARMEKGLHPNPANNERISALVLFTREQKQQARNAVSHQVEGTWHKGHSGQLGVRTSVRVQ